MSILAGLKTDSTIKGEKDVLFSNGPWDSGLYNCTVALAYLGKAKSGAMSVTLHLKADGRDLRYTAYVTSGNDKGNRNYFEKNGEKSYLPGFNLINSLCLLTVGKELSAMDTETKVVKLYNFEAKAEVNTEVQVLTELLGTEIIAGVLRQTVDKNVQDATGKYVPSGETRDENEIDKFFSAAHRKTVAECIAKAETGTFIDEWAAKNTGKTRNRAKGASAGTPGAPAAAAAGRPAASLFS